MHTQVNTVNPLFLTEAACITLILINSTPKTPDLELCLQTFSN
jgi:hypothetical protein